MVTYQIGDLIKAGAYLGEASMGLEPLTFFQAYQTVPSILVSSK